MNKLLTMSRAELTGLKTLERLEEKRLRQKEAAEMLGISARHVPHAFDAGMECLLMSKNLT